MKALSIKQPWASLIAHGIKEIENRTWKTHFRGRIYIHASGTPAKGISLSSLSIDQFNSIPNIEAKITYSAIIGEVDIIDCVVNHHSIWAEKTGGKYVGDGVFVLSEKPIYNWVLANPVLYEKPILNVKGKLSFWEPTPNQSCMSCNKEFFGHDPQYCCNGQECGCIGQPIEPLVCSNECYDKLMGK
ncbi:ASCH domain-containing protein [Flavobacterium sp. ALJ2]|uniref:ASCH domain-containing protein n=1 Tax=Flavobacterium sp. ALJ2 TaxID=2786960 RepID=UPI00189D6063|nr:ASCH domain-containing protein [Flavobacterium sp. ALJ2]MBF7090472.1 ASCH domain-containing protein [Flavobacterium sp. ALJ2]